MEKGILSWASRGDQDLIMWKGTTLQQTQHKDESGKLISLTKEE